MSVPRSCAGMEAPPRAPWVLLRGLVRESRHWGALPDLLAQALPAHPILCPDLPGNGVRSIDCFERCDADRASRTMNQLDQLRQ